MTDGPDGSGQIPRRTTRVGDGRAPVSGALAIILAVVAVVAGFLILRSISDGGEQALDFDGSGSGSSSDPAGEDAPDATTPEESVATLPTTTTLPPIITDGASVVVANANSVGGSASSMSRALETTYGFTMVDPVNSSDAIGNLDDSVIYFEPSVPAAEDVANSLATVLGGVSTIAPMPDPPPTRDGELNDADVLLMLGDDKAGKTLAELNPTLSAPSSPVTNPPIAGETTETTAG